MLPALLVVGLVVRLLFINNEGFRTDVDTYIAWALHLSQQSFGEFYSTIGFSDYPPGYFYILAAVGHFWRLFFAAHDAGYAVLHDLVKVPAVLADLGVGALVYAIVRRFAGTGYALGAAALYLLNPATIYISALWWTSRLDLRRPRLCSRDLFALFRSEDRPAQRSPAVWIVGAWLRFRLFVAHQASGQQCCSHLIIAFAFVDPQRRRARVAASAIGAGASILLALLPSPEPFHPSNPFAALGLASSTLYQYGSNVYPYNSVQRI